MPHYASPYEADRLDNGHTLIADQHHHQVLEVDPCGTIVWHFRNRRLRREVFPRLHNGSFKRVAEDGRPEGWVLYNRFAEGGGELIWDEGEKRPVPGLSYDRRGALCLVQYLAVRPGAQLTLHGKIRTEGVEEGRFANFQLFFLDEMGGPVTKTVQAPTSEPLCGDQPWPPATISTAVPEPARTVEVRLFINGPGKAWMKGLLLFE